MAIERFVKEGISRTFEKLFDLDKFKFDSICIQSEVIDNIIVMAKRNHPKEFVAFLDGKIEDKKLVITGLVYQEYDATEHSASPIFHFPNQTFYGSVHSHPGNSNKPSSADRKFFRKIGIINAIICQPYDYSSIRFYNHNGEEIHIDILRKQK